MLQEIKHVPTKIHRRGQKKSAQITYTLDFHELVTGNLKPNKHCVISYDPQRLVQQGCHYIHGDTHSFVFLNYQFITNGPVHQCALHTSTGMLKDPVISITGQGSMLHGNIFIPEGAQGLITWFSYIDDHGTEHYDSDFGTNYHFRFTDLDLALYQAVVVSDPQTPYAGFGVEVAADPAITEVSVRFGVLGNDSFAKTEVFLQSSNQKTDSGDIIWSVFGIAVPYQAKVRFKLYYIINGRCYKDDNNGKYYLAPESIVSPRA